MGIDKLRLISDRFPDGAFLEELNAQLKLPREERIYNIGFKGNIDDLVISRLMGAPMTITARKGVVPGFFLDLNRMTPNGRIVNIFECNPNKLHRGKSTLDQLLERLFQGKMFLKTSRIDLNADIVDVSVDFFRRSLRIPRKRKTTEFALQDLSTASYSNRGVTGFYIGRSPSLFRVYDKRLEMKSLGENVDSIPPIYTRLEWEYRHRKCPIRSASELSLLKDLRPFDSLEILDVGSGYDFHNELDTSLRRYTFNQLAADYGAHEAARILNGKRNFKRDFDPLTLNTESLRELLQESYLRSIRRFFDNQYSDTEESE
jgi:hypothetical protein